MPSSSKAETDHGRAPGRKRNQHAHHRAQPDRDLANDPEHDGQLRDRRQRKRSQSRSPKSSKLQHFAPLSRRCWGRTFDWIPSSLATVAWPVSFTLALALAYTVTLALSLTLTLTLSLTLTPIGSTSARSPTSTTSDPRTGPALANPDPGSSEPGRDADDKAKQQPNYAPSGRLAAETNTVAGGVVLKYHEPPEARKPAAMADWRLYVFKGTELLETVTLGGRSCWLVGRERAVADFAVDHPSCSKQHAVLQFRHVVKTNEFGDKLGRVRPYIIDLESANGTIVNGDRIPASRYIELKEKDMIQFGLSSREYVLILA
ncbi:MAG: hypothetical protein M1826_006542 [Phylliscum demangeonii]|nr:MAG: hypothetical protein M1826_006542 [Phylliscum demangeonii]